MKNVEFRIKNSSFEIRNSSFLRLAPWPRFLQLLDPLRDRRVVREVLARFFEAGEGVVVAAEDEENLDAELDEALVEAVVDGRVGGEKGEGAVDELQRDLGLRV